MGCRGGAKTTKEAWNHQGQPQRSACLATTKVGSTWWRAQSWEIPTTGMQLESGTHGPIGTEVGRLPTRPLHFEIFPKGWLVGPCCGVCEPGDWQSKDVQESNLSIPLLGEFLIDHRKEYVFALTSLLSKGRHDSQEHALCVCFVSRSNILIVGAFFLWGPMMLRPVLGREHMRCSTGANLANELKSYECTR